MRPAKIVHSNFLIIQYCETNDFFQNSLTIQCLQCKDPNQWHYYGVCYESCPSGLYLSLPKDPYLQKYENYQMCVDSCPPEYPFYLMVNETHSHCVKDCNDVDYVFIPG